MDRAAAGTPAAALRRAPARAIIVCARRSNAAARRARAAPPRAASQPLGPARARAPAERRPDHPRATSTADRAAAPAAAPRAAAAAPPPPRRAPPPPAAAPPPGRLRVAVDVDEVLGRFLRSLNAFLADEYGAAHDVADYDAYDFARVWRVPPDESNRRVHAFFASRHFADGVAPLPGAAAATARLRAAGHDLVVVTSRQRVIRGPTLDWLDAHFPGTFSDVRFGNHYALGGGPALTKAQMCADAAAHVLIDDNPAYAAECAAAGLPVLLFDWEGECGGAGYPWAAALPCGAPLDDARVRRVRSWAEAEAAVSALAAAPGGRLEGGWPAAAA